MCTFTFDPPPLSSRRFAPTTTYTCLVERGPVDKIPGGPNIKVFLGVTVMVGLCAIPVFSKPNEKRGHDLFSQEKPEAVVASTERLQREHYKKSQTN